MSIPLWGAAVGCLLVASPVRSQEPCFRFPFQDVAGVSGIEFRHRNGAAGQKHLPETMGSGVAWLDFDGDGWLDLYFGQSGAYPPAGGSEAANRLFRNLGDGRFRAVEGTGAEERGYAQGTLAADFDGDGATDLYLANVGADAQLRNLGDGTFAVVPLPPATGAANWSSAAAAADGDGDGDLDLYVVRYVDYDYQADLFCGDAETGERDYCDPSIFLGQVDRYFRNRGDGTFEEVTAAVGLETSRGRGLGVLFVDLDGDGAPDLYVSNDLNLNLLYRNRGDGTFEDQTLLSGAGASSDGQVEAGMGLGVGDFDGDGDPDLAVSNFDVETNTFYLNHGELFFEDASATSGFGIPSFNRLGFGLAVADYDRDGHLDVYIANGHIYERPKRENVAYRQPDLLLAGDGRGGFAVQPCAWLDENPRVSRGAATADFDNDGDIDLAVTSNDDEASLLRNEARTRGWLGAELIGQSPNTAAVGARVELDTTAGRQVRWVIAGQSYQSSADRRAHFGLGGARGERLEIRWPNGARQRLVRVPADRYLRFIERAGESGAGASGD